ncbi:MAG: DEAD/DEAH box helicase, partial [Chloroflexota bacterium]
MISSSSHDSVDALLTDWRADSRFRSNIAAQRTIPARAAQTVAFPGDLHPALIESLRARGIASLYTHQATAWRRVRDGQHVVVVTGTASGKTLCYNLPVLDRLLRDDKARALYLFPTKALAQDQISNLQSLISDLAVSAYDGDTPQSARANIRNTARVIVSNPDMVHAGILPHHTLWAEFFRHLQFIVIDEMHAYRGVFGSHVANVLRRLKRVAAFYGAAPQFILTSATIANPVELAERLIEESVALVDDDGAAKGEKHFVVYNPPVVDQKLGLRRSTILESVTLAQELLPHNVQTIIFARARRTVEL